ncbi:class II aldolase/adducin family protein [Sulfuriflexus mobilis]|uniref:class II aldolase/adducin family protein n=1 Tax=Sulfuriflexus mobilis TaxID=1811807 RepID=UPI000F84E71F|nr:class II aldolase/adducin family protein [Sulfuriflexus mobilis]
MNEQEGVIQYNLSHRFSQAVDYPELLSLMSWHQRMHAHGLIGQDGARYGGLAYGNMSHRLADNTFLISGTQTGGLARLTAEDYAHIEHCDIANNRVSSHGPIKPSSECMSHAAVYSASPATMAVIHVHSPDIWQQHERLGLACTPAEVGYGTPAMALAIAASIQGLQHPDRGCITMLGHEDGIICFADNMDSAGQYLLARYEQARSFVS